MLFSHELSAKIASVVAVVAVKASITLEWKNTSGKKAAQLLLIHRRTVAGGDVGIDLDGWSCCFRTAGHSSSIG